MNNVFNREDYRYQWRENAFKIPILFLDDLRQCLQRIRRGYCDKDVSNIDSWFLKVMPDMLQELRKNKAGSPCCLGEEYENEEGIVCNDKCHEEWDAILEQMSFLFRESDATACTRENPYEEEFDHMVEKYGWSGEKLKEEKDLTKRAIERKHYKEVMKCYYQEEEEMDRYREECKEQAFVLFAKWFRYLWR